jgi:hypothetical protein
MVSIIGWTRTTLKSGFRFWTKPPLGVRALDASDLPMVGYLLVLLYHWSPFEPTMKIRRPPSAGSPLALVPILGVIVRWILIGGWCWWRRTRCPSKGAEDSCHDRDTLNNLGGADVDPCTGIQTWAGIAWRKWRSQSHVLWCRPQGQRLQVFVFPDGKSQWPEGELSAVRKLDVKRQGWHGLLGRILSASPYLTRLCRYRVVRYLW